MAGDEDQVPEESDDREVEARSTALPPRVERWRKRSAAGAILTGLALGMQEALDAHKDEPQIMIQTSGTPPKDLPVEADFEYGRPRQSVVSVRPWLLAESDKGTPERAAGEAGAKEGDVKHGCPSGDEGSE